jgi:hypothetical protein
MVRDFVHCKLKRNIFDDSQLFIESRSSTAQKSLKPFSKGQEWGYLRPVTPFLGSVDPGNPGPRGPLRSNNGH